MLLLFQLLSTLLMCTCSQYPGGRFSCYFWWRWASLFCPILLLPDLLCSSCSWYCFSQISSWYPCNPIFWKSRGEICSQNYQYCWKFSVFVDFLVSFIRNLGVGIAFVSIVLRMCSYSFSFKTSLKLNNSDFASL